LCSALLRGARQDWYEQGDVWHRVAQMRAFPAGTTAGQLRQMTGGLRILMTADTSPAGALFGSCRPLAFAASWVAAFDVAGRAREAAASKGALERGAREILAHHVIFHWNRLGLADRTQSILARAACDTVMGNPRLLPGLRHGDD
jgi:thiopeptide-type bacteriocin biosynthesis protein